MLNEFRREERDRVRLALRGGGGLGLMVQGSGFGVWGSGFAIWGLGFGGWSLGWGRLAVSPGETELLSESGIQNYYTIGVY